jgi:hypothetical protein
MLERHSLRAGVDSVIPRAAMQMKRRMQTRRRR